MGINPNDFSCNEDFLSMFKKLRLLRLDCRIQKDNDQQKNNLLYNLGNVYFIFYPPFTLPRKILLVNGIFIKCPLMTYSIEFLQIKGIISSCVLMLLVLQVPLIKTQWSKKKQALRILERPYLQQHIEQGSPNPQTFFYF